MVKMELTLKNLILTMVHVHQAKSLPPLSPRLLALPPASDLPSNKSGDELGLPEPEVSNPVFE